MSKLTEQARKIPFFEWYLINGLIEQSKDLREIEELKNIRMEKRLREQYKINTY